MGVGGSEMTFFNFLYNVKAKEVGGLSKLCLNHFQIPSALVHNSYKLTGKFSSLVPLSLQRRPATPVMVIIPLNFARCTLPTHRNR